MRKPVAVAILCAALCSACEPPGNPHVADLQSPDGTYTVRLRGRATAPMGLISVSEHRLRVEVNSRSQLYVPARIVYIADSMDTAFNDRYGRPAWERLDVLRFPGAWERREEPPDVLTVRNRCDGVIRTLRVETAQDLFMMFDIAAGVELSLPTTAVAPFADLNWLSVHAEWGDGFAPSQANGAFTLHGGRSARFEFVVTVSPDRINFTEIRGQSERYR